MPAALARSVVDEIRAALDAGEDRASVVDRFSVSPRVVRDIARGRVTGRAEAPSAVAERWQAACMDPDEWEVWQDTNRRLTSFGDQATRPCDDCTLGFAADMRALGRCNGTPAGADEEDEPMDTMPARPEPGPPTRQPTPKQTRRWNQYHRLGSQSAAARAEGVDQGALQAAIERLEAEDAAQRREMARRIERLRDAGEVYRRLMEGEAA